MATSHIKPKNIKAKLKPNKEQIEQIYQCASLGMPQDQIATILGMSRSNLKVWMKRIPEFEDAWRRGKAVASFNVRKTAYDMATSGKNFEATKFWLKCQENWRETDRLELTGADGEEIKILTKVERDRAINEAMRVLQELEDE